MVSWTDSEASSANYFGHFADAQYAPDTCDDPNWTRITVGCTQLCSKHNLEPRKCVAFEGTNTGHKFYMCAVQNEVENCGLVGWVDAKHSETVQTSLGKLWALYAESNSGRIDDRIENAKLLKELTDENKKLEKKYDNMVDEVNKFIDDTCISGRKTNYDRITGEGRFQEQSELAMQLMEQQLSELKNVQRTHADVMKAKEKAWAEEKAALKKEMKNLVYKMFDLFKVSATNNSKLAKIKGICEE